MSEESNVISIATRKELKIVTPAEEAKTIEAERRKSIEADLKAIDEFRAQVAKGDVTGVLMIGRHLPTKLFLCDQPGTLRFQPEGEPALAAMAYVGFLHQIVEHFNIAASFAPVLVLDEKGNYQVEDPNDDLNDLDEEEDA